MELIEPNEGAPIAGIRVPEEVYWVLQTPAPLAGMKYPRSDFPWSSLKAVGFSRVVSLHSGSYDPTPLRRIFDEQLQDLVGGGPPHDPTSEKKKISAAVSAVVGAWRAGDGVVVHCVGGRGRTGTVLGCVLRELGFSADEAATFLDRVHKARGKPGWPESPWQSALVQTWQADA